MSGAVVWKRKRLLTAFLLLIFGFFLPFHFLGREINNNNNHNNNNNLDERCFTFESLVQTPATVKQDDPKLIQFIKDKLLFHSSYYKDFDTSYYNDTATTSTPKNEISYGQHNQSSIVDAYLNGKTEGFFIEAGAWNGEYLSNTLFFEKQRNWTGLLVEPNKAAFRQLLVNGNRKGAAAAANVCLSVHRYPEEMTFDAADVFGGVIGTDITPDPAMVDLRSAIPTRRFYRAQCLPLFSLLLSMGNPTVDYLSLDVEGAELAVLRTLPFDKVDITVVSVEVDHSDKDIIKKFMSKKGYRVLRRIQSDLIFVKENLV